MKIEIVKIDNRLLEGNIDMGKKSNIKEDKDWTVEDMVEFVLTGRNQKCKIISNLVKCQNVPLG